MNRLRQMIVALLTLVTLLIPVAVASSASAVNIFQPCVGTKASNSGVCNDVQQQSGNSANPVIHLLKVAINIISFAIGVAAVVILIVAGLRLITDGGNPKTVEQARSGIIVALVGIVIAILAQAIVALVLDRIA